MNSGMHLNDEQLAALVVEDTTEFAAHTRSCAECAAKADALRTQLADFSNFVRANAERSNTFWWRQRSAQVAPAKSFTRWAMAAAVVVIAAAASMPFIQQHAAPPKPQIGVTLPPVQQPQVSDEALLGEVQSDVLREYPDALAAVGTSAETAVAVNAQMRSAAKKVHKTK